MRQSHWSVKYRSAWPIFITSMCHTDLYSQSMTYIDETFFKLWIKSTHWTWKCRSHWPTFIMRSITASYWLIIPKYDIHPWNTLQANHCNMKYRSLGPTILCVTLTLSLNNSSQIVGQNHWTKKYRSPCSTFIMRSKVALHWLTIHKYDIQVSK